jgi:hypothetical protein
VVYFLGVNKNSIISYPKKGRDENSMKTELKRLSDRAKALDVPKDKLKMWFGKDCQNHLIYVNGPNGIFALLEIGDTMYDRAKCVGILAPLIAAKNYQAQFKGLWEMAPGSRSEYLGNLEDKAHS